MNMMGIGHMRVRMPPRFVPVPVAVRSGWQRVVVVVVVVAVAVMTVVVRVRMLVLQSVVHMLVAVRFGQVQGHAGQHQHAAGDGAETGSAVS